MDLRRGELQIGLDGVVHVDGGVRSDGATGSAGGQVIGGGLRGLNGLLTGSCDRANRSNLDARCVGRGPIDLRGISAVDLGCGYRQLRGGLGDSDGGTGCAYGEARYGAQFLSTRPGNCLAHTLRNIDDDTLVRGDRDWARPNLFVTGEDRDLVGAGGDD